MEDEGYEYANNWLVAQKDHMLNKVFDNKEDRQQYLKTLDHLIDDIQIKII